MLLLAQLSTHAQNIRDHRRTHLTLGVVAFYFRTHGESVKEGRTESSFIAYFASITYYYAIVAVSRPIEPGSTAQ